MFFFLSFPPWVGGELPLPLLPPFSAEAKDWLSAANSVDKKLLVPISSQHNCILTGQCIKNKTLSAPLGVSG